MLLSAEDLSQRTADFSQRTASSPPPLALTTWASIQVGESRSIDRTPALQSQMKVPALVSPQSGVVSWDLALQNPSVLMINASR